MDFYRYYPRYEWNRPFVELRPWFHGHKTTLKFWLWNFKVIIGPFECYQEHVSGGGVDKRSQRGNREVFKVTLSSHLCCWLINQAQLFSAILTPGRLHCCRKYVWTGKARRRSRLFGRFCRWTRGLLWAGWMSGLAVCLNCLYGLRQPDSIHRDSQGAQLGPGNDHDYAKCPVCLSVPLGDGYGM